MCIRDSLMAENIWIVRIHAVEIFPPARADDHLFKTKRSLWTVADSAHNFAVIQPVRAKAHGAIPHLREHMIAAVLSFYDAAAPDHLILHTETAVFYSRKQLSFCLLYTSHHGNRRSVDTALCLLICGNVQGDVIAVFVNFLQ